jgi:hypothetical protein
MHGYGHEELMFLEVEQPSSYKPKSDNGRMCRINVTGGTLTIDQIVERLRWLVDDNFQWDVQPQGKNVYKTQFPNKMNYKGPPVLVLFKLKVLRVRLSSPSGNQLSNHSVSSRRFGFLFLESLTV